jgi:hypothetical protein
VVEEVAKRRISKQFFKDQGSAGGKKAWAGMSDKEKSAEMKRRAKVRAKKRKA